MRCISCHASTRQARMRPSEAKDDWNAGEIVDDNFSIATDIKIDEYLSSNIKEILFEEYTQDTPFPKTEDGFLCSGIDSITDSVSLCLENDFEYLHYNADLVDFGGIGVYHPVAECGCRITFLESVYESGRLLSIALRCGDNIITVAADKDEECLSVKHSK